MHIRTDIHAGDIMDDVASGIKRTGNYLAQLVDEADSQATKLANDVMFLDLAGGLPEHNDPVTQGSLMKSFT